MAFPDPAGWAPNSVLSGLGGAVPVVTPELAQQMQSLYDQYAMMGQQPPFEVPQVGADATEYLTNLYYRDATLATQLAESVGMDREAFLDNVRQVDAAAQDNRGSNVFGQIGELTRVGRGEATGIGDFFRDSAALGAIGYGTSFLPGAGGTGTGTVAGSSTAAGSAAGPSLGAIEGWAPGAAVGGGAGAGAGAGGASLGAIEGWAPAAAGGSASATAPLVKNALTGAKLGGAGSVPNWLDYGLPAIDAVLGGYAADQASDAEIEAMDRAIAEQARQYDTTRSDFMPWIDAGRDALGQLADPQTNFLTSPGYEWRRSEGQRDVGNFFAAGGGLNSGNAIKALDEFNQNLASNEYGNWWNQQSGRAGLGQTATANVANVGTNAANNTSNYLAGQGLSRASGVLGKYGAISGAASDIYDNYLYRKRRRN